MSAPPNTPTMQHRERSDPPFRILMLLDQRFPPDVRVENEIESLTEAGFEVILMAIAPDERSARDEFKGATVLRVRIPAKARNWMRGLAGTIPVLSWFICRQVMRVVRDCEIHAIHAHDLYMCGGALRAGKWLNLPVVSDLHENWCAVLRHYAWSTRFPGRLAISHRRWERLEARWTRQSDHVVVITQQMKARIAELGVDRSNISVLPNTVNTREFDRFPVIQEIMDGMRSPFTLSYAGTINLHRGLDTLLRAMPAVLEEVDALLVIVGEGKIQPELEVLARSLGIADRVRFDGWQELPRLKSYFLGSDICVAPHVKGVQNDSALPHKLFQYMYLKRPVVVSNCVPMEDIVERTHCGLVFPSGDHEALARCLIELYRDPERRRLMGARGHSAVLQQYRWEISAQALTSAYSRLAHDAGEWSNRST